MTLSMVILFAFCIGVGSSLKPTVFPSKSFNVIEDVRILYHAMMGIGTDEGAIINILTKRSIKQRLRIAEIYSYQRAKSLDFVSQLKEELSGDFKNLIVALMTPPLTYYAKEMYNAMDGLGTDEDTIVEILCTLNNSEIKTMATVYEKLYSRSLQNDIIGDTSGYFQSLLLTLLQAERDQSQNISYNLAKNYALELNGCMEWLPIPTESTFQNILCNRSYPQLREIFIEYLYLCRFDIEKRIENIDYQTDFKRGLLQIVKRAKSKTGFFADRLYNNMNDPRTMTRIIVSRSEIDLADIKEEFKKCYGTELETMIDKSTSGDYRDCLLALVST
ncbi:annexin B9-like [Copidosoma floridanum]|uniref:annexin B9-like n=1 Tax=Copidosoma floridanum TaxID=29053 RepID=UPI0006C9CE92|nr:annexin B9-like [Copidosoma floridanum]